VKQLVAAFLAGLVFAGGLVLAGMTRPGKVFAFLDLTGDFDPSLAFVMGGGLLVYLVGFKAITRRGVPLLAPRFLVPTRRDIDGRLIVGSALFGIGWAIAGFCPGPALVAAGAGRFEALLFLPAMAAGMLAQRLFTRWLDRRVLSAHT